ncbi:MAG: response regulator [Gammaproteobacteria bacterium]|nr:response regulator [Gammaproteobacteria bacterium]
MRRTRVQSKTLITASFTIILSVLLILMVVWIKSVSKNEKILNKLHAEQEKVKLISIMRESAEKRALKLYQMTIIKDPFERDAIHLQIQALGSDFIKARDTLFANGIEEDELTIWNRARKHLNKGGQLQPKIAELIFDDNTVKAQQLLTEEMVPTQALFMAELDNLLTESNKEVLSKMTTVKNDNQTTYLLIFFLGATALLLGILSTVILRRTNKTEEAMMEQGDRIRSLYAISARTDLTADEQITETLRLGCRLLDMEIGKVGQLNSADNTSTFLNTVAPPELPIKRGKILPLDKTYCNITFSSPGPIALHHVGSSEYKNDPSYKFLGMEAYIGTTLYVRGKKFGTVHFVNRAPRSKPFSETDKDLLNLIASWISVTFERQIAQQQMQDSKDTAEAANQSKSAFLANMSHEIRTPLTAIIGYSEMLRDTDQTEEERTHEIDSIIRSGTHLQQIINDILDLSKIEAGQLVIELLPTSPFQMINELDAILGRRARDKGLKFNIDYTYPLPKSVTTDPTRFKQILFNILGNAIKFTQKGQIDINVSYSQPMQKLSVIVSDTGIGMSPEEMGRLFKPFSQADSSTTRDFGGTGLGLCISQQLANKLGGNITYTSTKGKGSEFEITIDVGFANSIHLINEITNADISNEDLNNHAQQISLIGCRILLAEDNFDTQQLVSIYVHKTGALVSLADNGKTAVELASSDNFDLILMDIQMPIMDGLEAIARLRKAGIKIPIIVLTANAMKEDKDKCISIGATDYLAKPIDLKQFYLLLKKYLNSNENSSQENVEQIITTISDDPEYQKLSKQFIDNFPELINQITQAMENSDWENMSWLVQSLKTSSGEFGFTDISTLAEVVYTKVVNEQYNELMAHILSLNTLYEQIVATRLSKKIS